MTTVDSYRLTDRYLQDQGTSFLTGVQALARVPIQQLRIDRLVGLNTAAFVSGYPGSPLGGFDQEIARAAALVSELPIVHQPGLNEELGASAVMGSQLASEQPDFNYDGVLGIWYGKAPGLDRATDALRHAVFTGTSRYGGALALVGDDPSAKSSTLPSSSDAALVDLHIPILYPGDVQEILDLGRHAVELSRLAGVWTSLKIVAAVGDGSGTADLNLGRTIPVIPDTVIDGVAYEHRPDGNLITPHTLELEKDFREARAELVRRYALANGLNRTTVDTPDAWIGIVASGFTYYETLQALGRLGLTTPTEIAAAGIRVFQMQMPVPFNPSVIQLFAKGLDEIVIVEEKNPTLEWLVKDALYGGPDQPVVVGKTHPDGRPLMRSWGILDADAMVDGLRERISARVSDRLVPKQKPRERIMIPLAVERSPYFCSGCPHNWSTKVHEDALVGAGIGCHMMVLLMDEERVGSTIGMTAMGSEGAPWIGMSPFVDRRHFTQNMGDGTFFHSGQLAIQAAVAAGVTVTYKILYNGTVAMTGGQDAVGVTGVPEISRILLAHGVNQVLVTTEDQDRYRSLEMPVGVKVWDRERMVEAQEALAAVDGVTVLIHDQACAAQTRRLRKRGKATTPDFRVVINHRLCEGCGDCGEVSNCLSVQSLATPLGTKTTIDQTSCNLDASCLDGDCPSFMTVAVDPDAPEPEVSGPHTETELKTPVAISNTDIVDIRLAGVGGTGVVTVAQILATAAMFDGYEVRGLDQTGISQKAGPVISDVRLARGSELTSSLISEAGADVILAFDLLVGASDDVLHVGHPERTVLIASSTETPTGSMVGRHDHQLPSLKELLDRAAPVTQTTHNKVVDAGAACFELFGDTSAANVYLLGVAIQAGVIPIAPVSIERAIELNGVAVERNLAAFTAGRAAADSPSDTSTGPGTVSVIVDELPTALADRVTSLDAQTQLGPLLEMLAADLVGYQSDRCASTFLDLVEKTAVKENVVAPGSTEFTEAVARGLHHLTAYKDEYEVARLLLAPEGQAAAEAVGGASAKVSWRLHPPVFRSLGMGKISIPIKLGRPLMKFLAKGRRLRGTAWDPFGRTEVRRLEQLLVQEYTAVVQQLLAGLTAENLSNGVKVASAAMQVKGYESLKLASGRALLQIIEAQQPSQQKVL
ncbi:MAG: indolepyruvate ferredoxin oxidoreductase family protein [Acidimicrobiales bacterium]|nr:indolepyruvate ferredoxin oxidoreductase family protein [Acidimicrobiales bacterium]